MKPIDMKFWTNPENFRVKRGVMTDGNSTMKSACAHKGENSFGFCGGCAARDHMALGVIERLLRAGRSGDALKVLYTMNAAKLADKPRGVA